MLSDPSVIDEMILLSRAGKPAVTALDQRLAGKIELSHVERQTVGRQVRDVLATRGWMPVRQRRLRAGQVFTSGAVYAPARLDRNQLSEMPVELLSFHDRVHQARANVQAFSANDYGVDAYLRDKRAEAEDDDAR